MLLQPLAILKVLPQIVARKYNFVRAKSHSRTKMVHDDVCLNFFLKHNLTLTFENFPLFPQSFHALFDAHFETLKRLSPSSNLRRKKTKHKIWPCWFERAVSPANFESLFRFLSEFQRFFMFFWCKSYKIFHSRFISNNVYCARNAPECPEHIQEKT